MKLFNFVLLLLLLVLQYQLWWGKGGYQDWQRLQATVQARKIENQALKVRNVRLAAEVEDLKHGLAAIEERARLELGMIKSQEVFYQFVE